MRQFHSSEADSKEEINERKMDKGQNQTAGRMRCTEWRRINEKGGTS